MTISPQTYTVGAFYVAICYLVSFRYAFRYIVVILFVVVVAVIPIIPIDFLNCVYNAPCLPA